jgi:hypothetical protein
MTYFYKNYGSISRKIGGEPPATEYVALDPQGTLRYVKDGKILEEFPIDMSDKHLSEYSPSEAKSLKAMYQDSMAMTMAKELLYPSYRKNKTTKPKGSRKVKIDKKCKCK